MKAYFLFDNLEVVDSDKLEEYKNKVLPTVEAFGGQYIILGGTIKNYEGDEALNYPVMIEFPSFEHANNWYFSPQYEALKKIRFSAVKCNATLIQGIRGT